MFSTRKPHFLIRKILNKRTNTENRKFHNRQVKKFAPNPDKRKIVIEKPKIPPTFEIKEGPRVNQLNLQMLSRSLYEQIFTEKVNLSLNQKVLQECRKSFENHKINIGNVPNYPDVDFKIPPLEGKDILEHFQGIGQQQITPYLVIMETLLKGIPEAPKDWLLETGWTRYCPGKDPESVPYPLEDGVVFDVEVCMKSGKAPTLATAVSHKAWYGWVSQTLFDGVDKPVTTHHYNSQELVPFESKSNEFGSHLNEHMKKEKLVIGHNVSYDRARIKEQYWLERTGTGLEIGKPLKKAV